MKAYKPVLLILGILLIDQALKIWVKTHMTLQEEIPIISTWFRFHFIENEGMAFGMSYGGSTGKIILSLLRLLAVGFIGFFLYRLLQKDSPRGLIISMSLIFAGALGNIIDSVFYGLIFESSDWHTQNVAQMFAPGGGYAPLLQGKVVDMLYFPLFQGTLPQWFPFWGGNDFMFFRPVFNIADSSITMGVFMILLFQKRYFPGKKNPEPEPPPSSPDEASNNETDK